tara:strand:- start:381 stop:650 length:270 start_codon:yes stop_codon:yes gene_type:complete
MTNYTIGTIDRGAFVAGDLLINGVDVGAVEVLRDDADNALRSAIETVEGVSASIDATGALVLSSQNQIEISGFDPTGQGSIEFHAGVLA